MEPLLKFSNWREYQLFLKDHNIISSMSAVGSCYDNAAAESFFGVLKRERVHRRNYVCPVLLDHYKHIQLHKWLYKRI
jgi:transposase InsO family protein